MNKVIIVREDNSSIEEKKKLINGLGYCYRGYWEPAFKGLALSDDKKYIEYMIGDKIEEQNSSNENYNPNRGSTICHNVDRKKIIETVLYSLTGSKSLISIVYSMRDDEQLNDEYFVSNYYLSDSAITKNEKEIEFLNFVQLNRYDPVENKTHVNFYQNFAFKDDNEKGLFFRYFGEDQKSVPAPHFHYASKRNAENLKHSTSLAIGLDNLIRYVGDLYLCSYQESELYNLFSSYDLGLPFVEIMKHPEKYRTFVSEKNFETFIESLSLSLAKSEGNLSRKNENKKFFQNLILSTEGNICGLEAVFIDLLTLKYLHDGGLASGGRMMGSDSINIELMMAGKILGDDRYDRILDYIFDNSLNKKNIKKQEEYYEKGR